MGQRELMTEPRLSFERATIAVLLSTVSTLIACVGAWLGVMRTMIEAYRSCPTSPVEEANAELASNLGTAAMALLAVTFIAALVGLVQGVRRRSVAPATVAAALGVLTLLLGYAAQVVPQTTMC